MNRHRNLNAYRRPIVRNLRSPSKGVILLVMLGLLSIFTLVAVTFVVSSGHARRGAAAASRVEQVGDPYDVLLNQAMLQIARGSNHPQSAIGHHGLLEDMYGNSDAVSGCVYFDPDNGSVGTSIYSGAPKSSQRSQYNVSVSGENYSPPMLIEIGAVSFGWDREPGIALVDDNGNSVVDDVAEKFGGSDGSDDCFLGMTRAHPATMGIPFGSWSLSSMPIIDNVDNFYAGRVITFVTGECAGQSSYIVRSKIATDADTPTDFRTVLFVSPVGTGHQPQNGDRFVINGRPFNGAGIGYNPYQVGSDGKLTRKTNKALLRALDMPYSPNYISTAGYGFDELADDVDPEPIAMLPNPTDSGIRDYLNRYASIVDADEDYDAPDEQNMLLSYTVATTTGYKTLFPSLHRPDLIRYHTNEHHITDHHGPRWLDVAPYIRRRYILRPDPSDHFDYVQDPSGDGWTPGEPYTDVNKNRQWDAFTVDSAGNVGPEEPYEDLPTKNQAYDVGDRSFFNTGFDAMDGPWDIDNDGDGIPDSIWVDLGSPVSTTPEGRFVKPLYAIMVRDLDGRINVNAHGSPKHYTHIHNDVYKAEGAYTPKNRPGLSSGTGKIVSEERVRMGMHTYALNQDKIADTIPSVVIVKTHSTGEIDTDFHKMSPQDVTFNLNKLFALSYYGDKPGSNSGLAAKAAYLFDPSSIGATSASTTFDYSKIIRGFEPAVGQGYSVADINMAQILPELPALGGLLLPTGGLSGSGPFYRINSYRQLLEGQGDHSGDSAPKLGRYGEGHLLRPDGAIPANDPSGYYPGLGLVPRAGTTDVFIPRRDYYSAWNADTTAPYYVSTGALVLDKTGSAGATLASSFYPTSKPPYRGDDDYPPLPFTSERLQNSVSNVNFVLGSSGRNSFRQSGETDFFGDYGTPGDFDSDGFVALDIMGNPVYEKMGTLYEDVDAPTEINLNRRYFAQTYYGATANVTTTAGRPITADIDAQYTPAELERLLRFRDSAAASLPTRLATYVSNTAEYSARSLTSESWDIPCPHIAPTPELSDGLRVLGLPLNNPSLGDLLRARFFLATGKTTLSDGAAFQIQSAKLATMAMRSYRLATADIGTAPYTSGQLTPEARKRWQTRLLQPDLGMGLRMDLNAPFGNGNDDDKNTVVDEPNEIPGTTGYNEPLMGSSGSTYLNFDGNRDGNSLPVQFGEEARQQYAKELYCLMMLLVDQNYVEPLPTSVNSLGSGPGAESDTVGRLPTLKEPNKVFPGLPDNKKTQRWLFARKIAQWAVNVVDFRDRDAIMTPFEFDVDPFFDNDSPSDTGTLNLMQPVSNGTWDVDGYLIKKTSTGAVDLAGDPDINQPWRGLVWGCEYPDLILTETIAFHDRRTQNLRGDTTAGSSLSGLIFSPKNELSDTSPATVPPITPTPDPHWDQRRVPQGTAMFELFATGNRHNAALPRELYTPVGNDLKLDLGRLAGPPTTGPTGSGTWYPVWRLAITKSHTRGATDPLDPNLSVAERIQQWPATCSLELNDPGLSLLSSTTFNNVYSLPMAIERVVHFSTKDPTKVNIGAVAGLNLISTTIEVFANQSTNALSALLSPGDYAVIGPYRASVGGPKNITTIGRTEKRMVQLVGGAPKDVDYTQPHAIIDLGDFAAGRPFLATSVNGVDEYPITGLSSGLGNLVKAPSGTGAVDNSALTAAALLDAQQIRPPLGIAVGAKIVNPAAPPLVLVATTRTVGLNVSEPITSNGPNFYYPPPNVLRSDDWLTSLTTTDQYSPVLDIPLDMDWDGKTPIAATNINPNLPVDVSDQTILNYKTVFLQRLANPLLDWHQYENPYLTVDWMPIDLTIFNGEPYFFKTGSTTSEVAGNLKYYGEPGISEFRNLDATGNVSNAIRFGSRQRGAPRFPVRGLYSLFDLWSQPNWLDQSPEFDTRPPSTGKVSNSPTTIAGTTTLYSDYYAVGPVKWQDPLDHTLGYLNLGYHVLRDLPKEPTQSLQLVPVREPIRRPMGTAGPTTGWYTVADVTKENDRYIGAPRRPFNWLTWNNRPFAGSMELMLVPATSQARLMHEYSMRKTITPTVPYSGSTTVTSDAYPGRLAPFDGRRAANHYMPSIPVQGNTNWYVGTGAEAATRTGRNAVGYSVTAPFAHLLNFFESSKSVVSDSALPNSQLAANYYRLFEFVTVPSRFSGTKTMHLAGSSGTGRNNAMTPRSGSVSAPNGGDYEHYGWPFTAPFNYIPLYREPGRININTIIPLTERGVSPGGTHPTERTSDNGAAIWRSVTNDFHPSVRWLVAVDGAGQSGAAALHFDASNIYRARDMVGATKFQQHKYFFNPSEDYSDNFYSAFASMFSDNPIYDPRGTDGAFGADDPKSTNNPVTDNRDDAFNEPFADFATSSGKSRHDKSRISLFTNPFRSFMSDYSDVIPSGNKHLSSSGDSLLAVDATLLRRRDTTWSPWNTNWMPTSADSNNPTDGFETASTTGPSNKLFTPAQIDPRFDPMFTLNYPRPFRQPGLTGPAWWQHSGYSSPLIDARLGVDTTYGGTAIPTMRVRDTDYRNTDRSPFFRYQMYTKLSNTVTTRSNVYAIWVTVGYFECERVNPNGPTPPVQTKFSNEYNPKHRYPDGFRILREMGSDSGEVQRHRSFAILDRTIPVGFLRGENLNVERAFIVKHVLD
ncbi:MAG: hypothetical protein K8U03_07495 [Planctomycetia bacterium]|nr:hypothetical protein [Planctomycetia bacterium]